MWKWSAVKWYQGNLSQGAQDPCRQKGNRVMRQDHTQIKWGYKTNWKYINKPYCYWKYCVTQPPPGFQNTHSSFSWIFFFADPCQSVTYFHNIASFLEWLFFSVICIYSISLRKGLSYEKLGDARWEFLLWPSRGTEKGVVQALLFLPLPKAAANRLGNEHFAIKALFCCKNTLHWHWSS